VDISQQGLTLHTKKHKNHMILNETDDICFVITLTKK